MQLITQIALSFLILLAAYVSASAQVLGRIPFQTHPYQVYDASGAARQALDIDGDVRGPKAQGNLWDYQHMTDGTGFQGRNFVRMYWWDYDVSRVPEQEIGFIFAGSSLTTPSGGWRDGVEYFIRFRIRQHSPPLALGGGPGTVNNKFLITNWGGTRAMIHMRTAGGYACGPLDSGTYPAQDWVSMRISRNIDGPDDGYCANIPVRLRQWNHLQYSIRFGASGTAFVKAWVNNNSYSSPSAADTTGSSWGEVGMDGPWQLGGYVSDESIQDVVWDLQDFEVATSFNSQWSSTTAPGPTAPTNLRILREVAYLVVPPLPVLPALGLLLRRRKGL
jgi:hypothetical protein